MDAHRLFGRIGAIEILEELRIGLEQHDITAAVESGAVGTQTTVETVECWVLRIGLRVDSSGFCISSTTSLLGSGIGLRQQFLTNSIS